MSTMSLLERVIAAHKCRSMHHYIAMDALSLLKVTEAQDWKNLMLRYNTALFEGAKAPDADFKDFKNHVLHVAEGEWGGARDAATEWYAKSVEALRAQKWDHAAYCLGVLSHYYADVCQPFHTGQTEEEGAVHRAVEWSIFKSVDKLQDRIAACGYPQVERPDGVGFVSDMVRAAAEHSHPYYNTFIDHYDIDVGADDPVAGPDDTLLDAATTCFAYATAGVAEIFTAAIVEAEVAAPKTHMTLRGYLAAANIPLRKLDKKLDDIADRRTVARMYKELQETGKVLKTLPDDDKAIRKMHARQVLRVPLKELNEQTLGPLGTKNAAVLARAANLETDVEIEVEAETETETVTPVIETQVEPEARPAPKPEPIIEDVVEAEAEYEIEQVEDTQADIETADDEEPDAVEEIELDIDQTPQWDDADQTYESDEVEFSEEDLAELAAMDLDADEDFVAEVAAADAAAASDYEERTTSHMRQGRLTLESPLVDAPSIGRKTAKRFAKVGIRTVLDLLDADPEFTAAKIDTRHITAETIIDWQDHAMLKMEVPSLRALDVQTLVGAGIRSAKQLSEADAAVVFSAAMNFLGTAEGERVNRFEDEPLSEIEVADWIDLALEEAA